MSFNLALLLREAARENPQAPYLHFGDSSWSYGEIDATSDRIAAGLQALGLQAGDRIGICLPNSPEFVQAYFGALKAGLVVVPMNPMLRAADVMSQLTRSGARLLVTHANLVHEAVEGAMRAGAAVVSIGSVPPDASSDPIDDGPAGRLIPFATLTHATGDAPLTPTNADDTAVIIFTSGTTGSPKGAELTHIQLYFNATLAGQLVELSADDVVVGVLPFFHVFGLSSVLHTATRFGAAVALVARFDPAEVLETIARTGATVLPGVPTVFIGLIAAGRADKDLVERLDTLRFALSGGAALSPTHLTAFEQTFPQATVLEGYGLTECASVATFNTSRRERRVGSIGKPLWGTDLRLVDSDGEVILDSGDARVGEIQLRGHHVMKGYLEDPESTAATIRGGWLATGDLGRRDEDGYYYLVDRLKDVIVRGGYNVYPREIEEVLLQHPEVVEAAVVGRPDDRLGEEVVAFVVAVPGTEPAPDDLLQFVRDRVAAYKYPRHVEVIDALPRSSTGKVLKRTLTATLAPPHTTPDEPALEHAHEHH